LQSNDFYKIETLCFASIKPCGAEKLADRPKIAESNPEFPLGSRAAAR
jgi:hypothetical protein